MRELTYFVACSADGFIAREDGKIDDFRFEGEHVPDILEQFPETIPTHLREYFEVDSENQKFDTVLMGRHTFEVGSSQGITSPYRHLNQFVVSNTLEHDPDPEVDLLSSNVVERIRSLKQDVGLGIWLCGGGVLASTLYNEIDRIVLKVNPFLMGRGKPLFADPLPRTDLHLTDRRDYSNGFSIVDYRIERPPSE